MWFFHCQQHSGVSAWRYTHLGQGAQSTKHTHTATTPTLLSYPHCYHTHIATKPTLLPHPHCYHTHTATTPILLPHPHCYHTHIATTPTLLPHPHCYHTHTATTPTLLPHPHCYHTHTAKDTHLSGITKEKQFLRSVSSASLTVHNRTSAATTVGSS